jgi:hypothetical protein
MSRLTTNLLTTNLSPGPRSQVASAFFRTDPLNGAQPILNECFAPYSLFLLFWKRPYA